MKTKQLFIMVHSPDLDEVKALELFGWPERVEDVLVSARRIALRYFPAGSPIEIGHVQAICEDDAMDRWDEIQWMEKFTLPEADTTSSN